MDLFRFVSGVDVVDVDADTVLLRSDTISLTLRGGAAGLVGTRVAPLLRAGASFAEIADVLPGVSAESLRRHLAELVAARVVLKESRREGDPGGPWESILLALGLTPAAALERLRGASVAIFGLEWAGAQLALWLGQCGVGRVVLVDPFPLEAGNLPLIAGAPPESIGAPREQVVRGLLAPSLPSCRVEIGPGVVTRESVLALAGDATLLVGCFDRGFSSAHHWINRASASTGVPAVYAETRAHRWLVGPFVVPSRTACYMCYRMRSVAAEADFATAMAYERHLDRTKRPALHERAVFPAAVPFAASQLCMEVVRHLAGLHPPALANRLLDYDCVALTSRMHPVLRVPGCPVCGTIPSRYHPPLASLVDQSGSPGDLAGAAEWLVSPLTGVITAEYPVAPDPGDPPWPALFGARLANHRFRGDGEPTVLGGKGITLDEARTGALGEAVERYSAETWWKEEITYAARAELPGRALDPRELVLHSPDQYAALPYAPYRDGSTLGWVRARSLVTGEEVHVPALAVFMGYEPRSDEERLCSVTTTGLAAGGSLVEAVLRAALEVLERDAFMLTWLHRLPGVPVDPAAHPDPQTRAVVDALRAGGVEVRLLRLPTDHGLPVFAAFGIAEQGADGPAAALGLGAAASPARAARNAILELGQVRAGLRHDLLRAEVRERAACLARDPTRVADLRDHALLYADASRLRSLEFLWSRASGCASWDPDPPGSDAERLLRLVEILRARGEELLYFDLTPPDMAELHIRTARVLIPGFQPLHFGAKEARLGGKRLWDFPSRIGERGALRPDELNLEPHPFA